MAIKLVDIVKRYDKHLAVDNINLTINKGEIFGLLGPNGAGKSTTIKMMMGLLKLTGGEIYIDDRSIRKEALSIKKDLGLVPQELAIYDNMSARENVAFFGSLYGLKGSELKQAVDEALDFVGLVERQKEKPKKFSGGLKRRLNIACAIVHKPNIIIMDEPTVGIDPQSRNHILESVKALNASGSTVIYTSHYMEEVESLCDRIGIIDHGKLIACGPKEEIINQIDAQKKIIIEALDIRFNPVDEMREIAGVKTVTVNENTLEVETTSAQDNLQDILFLLSKHEVKVKKISIQEPDLESVFLALTGRKLRD